MKREYPDRPILGVGGVVIHRDRVLLIRRGRAPMKGRWSIPGGMVEVGEKLEKAVRRELKEETGVDARPMEILQVFDRIELDRARVRYHYVIVDYACRKVSGRLRPASDVLDARWVDRGDLGRYHLSRKAKEVVLQAFAFFEKRR